ncbi:MAG TPA: hypothetical protein VJ995_00390 [Geothermobacteraceae bacterium]|nr:hypothetical protein [Geothermobacteraceae bacterium]
MSRVDDLKAIQRKADEIGRLLGDISALAWVADLPLSDDRTGRIQNELNVIRRLAGHHLDKITDQPAGVVPAVTPGANLLAPGGFLKDGSA